MVRALAPDVPPGVRVAEAGDDATGLLDLWEGVPLVIAVDAVRAGGAPGEVLRMEVGPGPLPTNLGATSTHGFSFGQAAALGQALGRLPGRLVLYGIEAVDFGPGHQRTPAVARAVGEVRRRILEELKSSGAVGPAGAGRS